MAENKTPYSTYPIIDVAKLSRSVSGPNDNVKLLIDGKEYTIGELMTDKKTYLELEKLEGSEGSMEFNAHIKSKDDDIMIKLQKWPGKKESPMQFYVKGHYISVNQDTLKGLFAMVEKEYNQRKQEKPKFDKAKLNLLKQDLEKFHVPKMIEKYRKEFQDKYPRMLPHIAFSYAIGKVEIEHATTIAKIAEQNELNRLAEGGKPKKFDKEKGKTYYAFTAPTFEEDKIINQYLQEFLAEYPEMPEQIALQCAIGKFSIERAEDIAQYQKALQQQEINNIADSVMHEIQHQKNNLR